MKTPLIIAAIAGSMLTTGCVIAPLPDYPFGDAFVVAPSAPAPVEIYEPSVIIVEHGVRHDRHYYQRHPEAYRRDLRKYPDRFRNFSPHHPHGQPVPPPSAFGPSAPQPRPHYGRSVLPQPPQAQPPQPQQEQPRRGRHALPQQQPPVTSQIPAATHRPPPAQAPVTPQAPAPALPPASSHRPPPAQAPVTPQAPAPALPPASSHRPAPAQTPGAMQPQHRRDNIPQPGTPPTVKQGNDQPTPPAKNDDKKKKHHDDDTSR